MISWEKSRKVKKEGKYLYAVWGQGALSNSTSSSSFASVSGKIGVVLLDASWSRWV